jgi:hypothetical protein
MDKPLAERVLDAFEFFYRESSALRLILADRHVSGWEGELKKLMAVPWATEHIRAMFQEVRAALRDESDPAQALQALLRIFPPDRNVN